MKIKIIKASNSAYWYTNKIGKIFDAWFHDKYNFKVRVDSADFDYYVLKEDCEIINNNIQTFSWKQLHNKTLKIYVGEDLSNGTDYGCITTIGVDEKTGKMYVLNREIIK